MQSPELVELQTLFSQSSDASEIAELNNASLVEISADDAISDLSDSSVSGSFATNSRPNPLVAYMNDEHATAGIGADYEDFEKIKASYSRKWGTAASLPPSARANSNEMAVFDAGQDDISSRPNPLVTEARQDDISSRPNPLVMEARQDGVLSRPTPLPPAMPIDAAQRAGLFSNLRKAYQKGKQAYRESELENKKKKLESLERKIDYETKRNEAARAKERDGGEWMDFLDTDVDVREAEDPDDAVPQLSAEMDGLSIEPRNYFKPAFEDLQSQMERYPQDGLFGTLRKKYQNYMQKRADAKAAKKEIKSLPRNGNESLGYSRAASTSADLDQPIDFEDSVLLAIAKVPDSIQHVIAVVGAATGEMPGSVTQNAILRAFKVMFEPRKIYDAVRNAMRNGSKMKAVLKKEVVVAHDFDIAINQVMRRVKKATVSVFVAQSELIGVYSAKFDAPVPLDLEGDKSSYAVNLAEVEHVSADLFPLRAFEFSSKVVHEQTGPLTIQVTHSGVVGNVSMWVLVHSKKTHAIKGLFVLNKIVS